MFSFPTSSPRPTPARRRLRGRRGKRRRREDRGRPERRRRQRDRRRPSSKPRGTISRGSCCASARRARTRNGRWRCAASWRFLSRSWDARERFETLVVAPFVAAYEAGRTPNPCVVCNEHVKFGLLLDEAGARGADRLATGHYARIEMHEGRPALLRGRDRRKEQSYFLARVPRGALGQGALSSRCSAQGRGEAGGAAPGAGHGAARGEPGGLFRGAGRHRRRGPPARGAGDGPSRGYRGHEWTRAGETSRPPLLHGGPASGAGDRGSRAPVCRPPRPREQSGARRPRGGLPVLSGRGERPAVGRGEPRGGDTR